MRTREKTIAVHSVRRRIRVQPLTYKQIYSSGWGAGRLAETLGLSTLNHSLLYWYRPAGSAQRIVNKIWFKFNRTEQPDPVGEHVSRPVKKTR